MKCYIAITYLLVARHVENDEVALHFIFEIKLIALLVCIRIVFIISKYIISYWYTYSFEIYFLDIKHILHS